MWSSGKRADFQFVKNVRLEGNIIFNSGSPSGLLRDNVIVASNDNNGINIAQNITLLNNILYHNTHNENGKRNGEAPSLTFGYTKKAPIKDVTANGNIIVGGHNVLRLSIAESLNFNNNIVYGAVQIGPNTSDYLKNWNFDTNTYYSKLKTPFRISRGEKYNLKAWQQAFQLDENSKVLNSSDFNLNNTLHISKHRLNENKFNLALFNADGNDVPVDFSKHNLKAGVEYKIYDVENSIVVVKSGQLPEDFKVMFPMQLTAFERPHHNTLAQKTESSFGVFVIEFEAQKTDQVSIEKDNFFKRFFKWLGF